LFQPAKQTGSLFKSSASTKPAEQKAEPTKANLFDNKSSTAATLFDQQTKKEEEPKESEINLFGQTKPAETASKPSEAGASLFGNKPAE